MIKVILYGIFGPLYSFGDRRSSLVHNTHRARYLCPALSHLGLSHPIPTIRLFFVNLGNPFPKTAVYLRLVGRSCAGTAPRLQQSGVCAPKTSDFSFELRDFTIAATILIHLYPHNYIRCIGIPTIGSFFANLGNPFPQTAVYLRLVGQCSISGPA